MHHKTSRAARARSRAARFAIITLLASIPALAGPKVPLKSELKARVGEFYAAYSKRDWAQLRELVAPFVRECSSAAEIRHGWTEDGRVRVLSWKILDVRYDASYVGREFKVECTGQVYRPEAGAVVVVSQLDKQDEDVPTLGKLYFPWVLVGGSWFAAGPE